ncbi:MAG: L-fucose/L-arabinose isomerase family protein, partial [Vallitaleaceae bacterium]|nr:L-fucose/L-arabinose isomerase family protein [Vallitaleaceae bacterium]
LGLKETPAISMANEVTYNHPDAIEAWREIEEWIRATTVVRTLQYSKMGFLGHTYPGMLDMYSDFTMIQAQTGMHVEILEMCDLEKLVNEVTNEEKVQKLQEVKKMFVISEDSTADPLAKKPTEEQLDWSCTMAVAQEKMVKQFDLDALTYYYRGLNNNLQHIQEGFILGHSLLTAQGIPCSGEGDMKTGIAMKICDILNVGGSFCEIVVGDFKDQTLLLGHDGPFHIAISDGKPVLRGLGLFHGKSGSGISVEATVKKGDITTLGLTQTKDGKLKMIVSHGIATDGPVMRIGNTMTPVKFAMGLRAYMNKWFMEGPTHHCAMSIGNNVGLFEKVANLMGIEFQVICE